MSRPKRLAVRPALVLLALLLAPWPVAAQGSGTGGGESRYENLELLPETLSRREMSELMKGYALALGVRCEFCHVGNEADGFDYPADDKNHKIVARQMIRMTRAINQQFLSELGDNVLQVNCATCHRGRAEPADLEDVLAETVAEEGSEAAVAKYRQLRKEHYGGPAYDFRAGSLNRLADRLVDEDRLDAAAAMLELNLELHPDIASIHFLLGEVHRKRGDTKAAAAAYSRALELDPENTAAKVRLDSLK